MKKFETTAKYKEVAKVAKEEFGINPVGKKTVDLIEMVNAKIEEKMATETPTIEKKKGGKTLADYGLEEGQVVTIAGFEVKGKTILANRQVSITRASRAHGYIKGRLVNEEDGSLQKTEISITLDIIIEDQKEEEVVA